MGKQDNDMGALIDFGTRPPIQEHRRAVAGATESRAIAKVQGAIFMAKQFPRDQTKAFQRIIEACRRRTLAEDALYEYSRGGSKIEGPSIRLAEVMAQAWGNMEVGVTEVEQRDGESVMEAFAWDLETNVMDTKTFTVRHERDTKQGKKKLEDGRDIYEAAANVGARRKRACILAIIPGDIVDAAVKEVKKTLSTGSTEPLADRARNMVVKFSEMGVTQAMIEKRLGHKLDAITESEIVKLGKVFASIRDEMGKREDFFDVAGTAQAEQKQEEAPLVEEERVRRVELAEVIRAKWSDTDVSIGAQVKAIRAAGGTPTPGEGGAPNLLSLSSDVLSKILEAQ